ncbi:MAG: CHAP domain-containing protein [Sphingorhabdus sp.]
MFRKKMLAVLCAAALLVPAQASALQCVPFARQVSGINIFGNAKTWWYQAEGRYARGGEPRVGAVMAFKPTRSMPIGHVGMVSKIVSEREVLIDHSNWSRINGRRGHIERGARVVDVSPNGDWSQVRVWYAPLKDLGKSTYPLYGFIYKDDEAGKLDT